MAIKGKETRACFSCSKVEHLKRDCWRRPKNQSMAARNRVREQSGSQGSRRGGGRQRDFSGRRGQPSSLYQKTTELVRNAGWRGQNSVTGSREANRTSYLNALYDIQANGMAYEGEGAHSTDALQTLGTTRPASNNNF